MAKKKQPEYTTGGETGDSMMCIVKGIRRQGKPEYTFEGNIRYKDGETYGKVIEETESHIIVEVKGAKKNEYPDRHEFRKEVNN